MSYTVLKTDVKPNLSADFDNDPVWSKANIISPSIRLYPKPNFIVRFFRKITGIEAKEAAKAAAENYNPVTELKLLYDDQYIYGLFRVKDRFVRACSSKYGEQACSDSCVEFFIRPQNNLRYYNFELTAGGYLLLYNITDLRGGKYTPVSEADCNTVIREHSLPSIVDPEITEPTTWTLGFAIPIQLFVKLGDSVNPSLSGQTWTGNVYKCGDDTSHPHWFTWMPLTRLDFHLPECFGEFHFE